MLHILIFMSLANEYLIKSPSANPHEFVVYQQNSSQKKISHFFLQCAESAWLEQQVKKAQYQFLNGSLQESKKLFAEIADKKWDCDWNDEQRKTIVFAMVRIAEIEQGPLERRSWLKNALHFDDTIHLDTNIFPPPLISEYRELKTQIDYIDIAIPEEFQKFNHLLRNGKYISLGELHLKIPTSTARYTFVSDSYITEHTIINAQELYELKIQAQPLVTGTCDQFKLHQRIQNLENISIFFSMLCQKSQLSSLQQTIETPNPHSVPIPLPVSEKKSWLQRNFLWVGLATVGTILIANKIAKDNQRQETIFVPTVSANR